ncbi:MAG: hypothetical protein JWN04_5960 [Myxococcaceae bacterium]|nr:hypothetical protein [Myxococcaceae bacterium]
MLDSFRLPLADPVIVFFAAPRESRPTFPNLGRRLSTRAGRCCFPNDSYGLGSVSPSSAAHARLRFVRLSVTKGTGGSRTSAT